MIDRSILDGQDPPFIKSIIPSYYTQTKPTICATNMHYRYALPICTTCGVTTYTLILFATPG